MANDGKHMGNACWVFNDIGMAYLSGHSCIVEVGELGRNV